MLGRLRKARNLAGLTTKTMAVRLADEGVTANDAKVSRIETGVVPLDLAYAMAAARIGRVSLDWIVWGVGDRGRAGDVIRRLHDELQRAEADYVIEGAEPMRFDLPPEAPAEGEPADPPPEVLDAETRERARQAALSTPPAERKGKG